MELKVIKNERQYEKYLDWVDAMFNKKVLPDSPEGKKLEVALLLIKQYEDTHYDIPFPDPVDVIKLKMKEMGIRNKDLTGKVGSKGYVSMILNRRKPLTLKTAKWFHKELNIPAEVFLT